MSTTGPVGVAPIAYAEAGPAGDGVYQLGPGDKLRIVIYGQEGLTNTYAIDAAGAITLPLIGAVPARGRTPAKLAAEIAARLRSGYIREPSVAVEIDSYRPFFILGEVAAPGQYPYVPNMTVESAVAIAGGFSTRAKRDAVTLTHTDALFAPSNVGAMADAIKAALDDPAATMARAQKLRERISEHFSQSAMVEGVLAGYRDAFAKR